MKRFIITLVISLLCVSCAYASVAEHVKSATDDSILFSTASVAALYTKSVNLRNANTHHPIGVMYKATGTTIDLNLAFEQSYKPPVTEGTADSDHTNPVLLDRSITTSDWELATVDSVILPYMRFIVNGQGSNGGNTLFQIKVIKEGR